MIKEELEHNKSHPLEVWYSKQSLKTFAFLSFTILSVYVCYLITIPFLSILVWALALAVLFMPLQLWIEKKLKLPSLAAFISVMVIISIVVVPFFFLGEQLILRAIDGTQLIEQKVSSGQWKATIASQEYLTPIVNLVERYIDLPNSIATATKWLGKIAGSILQSSIFQLLKLVLVFYVLFYFLRDRQVICQTIENLLPLTKNETNGLFSRVNDTIFATIYGMLIIGMLQGLLGGLMFWLLDLPAPILWSLVMSLLAILPVVGPGFIWVPAAFYLAIEGSWGSALTLSLWGVLVVSTIDNLLRPLLVGNRLQLHSLLVFLSFVGGVILFGSSGIILGPIMLTVTVYLLNIWSLTKPVKK